jgi:hypothetical protein
MWGWMTLADLAGTHPAMVERLVQALPRLEPSGRSQLTRAFDLLGEPAYAALRAALDAGDPGLRDAAFAVLQELRPGAGERKSKQASRNP